MERSQTAMRGWEDDPMEKRRVFPVQACWPELDSLAPTYNERPGCMCLLTALDRVTETAGLQWPTVSQPGPDSKLSVQQKDLPRGDIVENDGGRHPASSSSFLLHEHRHVHVYTSSHACTHTTNMFMKVT